MGRELGVGRVPDQAKKVQRLATASHSSNSSDGDPNGDPPSDVSLHARPPLQYLSGAGHGQDQDQAFERFGGRQFTALDLLTARFFVEKAFFDVETQAVLIQGLGTSGFITGNEPGIIWLVKQTSQGQSAFL